MTRRQKKSSELTPDEIKDAIEQSGFPLEIRLLSIFDEEAFDPVPGHQFFIPETAESVEVDVLANCLMPLANNRGFVNLHLVVEAKNWGNRVAFVGFKWKQPDVHTRRVQRSRLAGIPSCLNRPGICGGSNV